MRYFQTWIILLSKEELRVIVTYKGETKRLGWTISLKHNINEPLMTL